LFLFGHLVFWTVFALYLDQVFPNEFGSKKHPLFFIKYFFNNKQSKDYAKVNQVISKDNIEEVDNVFLQME